MSGERPLRRRVSGKEQQRSADMNHPIISKIGIALLLCVAAVAQAQSTTFHANGAFASAFPACSESQTSQDCIFVQVDTSSATGTTFLLYDHSILDLNTGASQDTSGNGIIPNSAFTVQGKTTSLNVDTSTVLGFVNQICTFDPNTNTTTCNSASGGVVTGNWTVIPALKSHSSGSNKFTTPTSVFIIAGTSDMQMALANVTVLGDAAANATASVGTNHNTTINVSHH